MAEKRGLGGLGGDRRRAGPAPEGWGDYALRFLNPFSSPPGQPQTGPSLREVIVPPDGTGVTPAPQGWGDYLQRFVDPSGAPPGQQPSAEPIDYDNTTGGPQPYSETLRSEMAGRFADDVPASRGKPNAFSDMLLNNWVDRTVGRSQDRRGLQTLPPEELERFRQQDRQSVEDIYRRYSRPSAEPIGFRPARVGPYPKRYRNELPPPPLPQAELPPGWMPPPETMRDRILLRLEEQRKRRSSPPEAVKEPPVLRRKKPKHPKARESEA